jgi:DNA-directed RNA polymerase subunit beta
VREAMRLAYGDDVYEEGIAAWTRTTLVEAAGNVTRGVPIATPVFDGAKEADVNDALIRAGFDSRASRCCSTAARASSSRAR